MAPTSALATAQIDSIGCNITIARSLLHLHGCPDEDPANLGSSTLTLTGVDTYMGTTSINAGVLTLNGDNSRACHVLGLR